MSWLQHGLKTTPEPSQDHPRPRPRPPRRLPRPPPELAQDLPDASQDPPRAPQNPPRDPPRDPPRLIFKDFAIQLGGFWISATMQAAIASDVHRFGDPTWWMLGPSRSVCYHGLPFSNVNTNNIRGRRWTYKTKVQRTGRNVESTHLHAGTGILAPAGAISEPKGS